MLNFKNKHGFTLLETLIAFGILATVFVSLLSIQTSTISVAQISRNQIRATWAMRSAIGQLMYVIDTLGVDGVPRNVGYSWSTDGDYSIHISSEKVNIDASKLLLTGLKVGQNSAQDSQESPESSGDENKASIWAMVDKYVPKDIYLKVELSVNWEESSEKKSLKTGMLLVNDQKLNLESLQTLLNQFLGGSSGG